MDLIQFLTWLATSAGAAGALAFITERIPAFQALSPSAKGLVHLVGSLIFALSAYAILNFVPAEVQAQIAPWFQVGYGVVYTWIAGQIAHKNDPQASDRARR